VTVAPTLYMATRDDTLAWDTFTHEPLAAILISYAYMDGKVERPGARSGIRYRHWCMDSGAYTAWKCGKPVQLDDYVAFARDMWQADPTLHEVITLDQIGGSWHDTRRNTDRLWAAGVPAMPVYHMAEPEDVLVGYARDYPKICVGGCALIKSQKLRMKYIRQVFARTWPCAVHFLATSGWDVMMEVPLHSCDASSWRRAAAFGAYRAYGNGKTKNWQHVPVRKHYNLRVEVEAYLAVERQSQWKWRREMREVGARLHAAGWRGYADWSPEAGSSEGAGAGAAPLA
jgi:hypothetical protein